ncbi:type II toxin-antitoxin system HicB family antitoxin [Enterococcus sp. 669A]|uniref:Type II toxin-antitoxin system HicB family antitoxin n=1 Tax=Candidatus Enterococcus moelleringii TaxID=2815325 RepID=A0ABS3LAQ9_9ENTE|nr:type II toxin-antitoxin system HicB family antitoxin [Enterococcus sp. 669A]MBO1306718.1 type II toxin-antitoxin system HicB family antitoxin [Enterococcus sp. 669A]
MTKEEYLTLEYPVVIKKFYDEDEEQDIFSAEIKEMPGLKVYGDSYQEVYDELLEAKEIWVDARLAEGRDIPLPFKENHSYSGRLTVRIGKDLHRRVADYAEDDGMSLNQSIISLLEKGLSATAIGSQGGYLKETNRELDKISETLYELSIKNFKTKR